MSRARAAAAVATLHDTAVVECLEAAVLEVISDPVLTMADLIGVLEDLVPGQETLNTLTAGDRWTAPARRISRGDVRLSLSPGEQCSWRVMHPGVHTQPHWSETPEQNTRLSQLIRGDL